MLRSLQNSWSKNIYLIKRSFEFVRGFFLNSSRCFAFTVSVVYCLAYVFLYDAITLFPALHLFPYSSIVALSLCCLCVFTDASMFLYVYNTLLLTSMFLCGLPCPFLVPSHILTFMFLCHLRVSQRLLGFHLISHAWMSLSLVQ